MEEEGRRRRGGVEEGRSGGGGEEEEEGRRRRRGGGGGGEEEGEHVNTSTYNTCADTYSTVYTCNNTSTPTLHPHTDSMIHDVQQISTS